MTMALILLHFRYVIKWSSVIDEIMEDWTFTVHGRIMERLTRMERIIAGMAPKMVMIRRHLSVPLTGTGKGQRTALIMQASSPACREASCPRRSPLVSRLRVRLSWHPGYKGTEDTVGDEIGEVDVIKNREKIM